MTQVVVAVIVTAVFFDFTNGFHDTANAMATSIATGALRPRTAVVLAGVLNLAGAFLSVQVAKTISGGLVVESRITPVGRPGRVGGRHPVEPAELAAQHALELVARAVRRPA
jgi:phosphate/sulfate permease